MSVRPRVFISYAHYSPEHVEAVRRFWTLLRDDGIDVHLDLPAAVTRQDWPVWMMREFGRSDYFLVIASAVYRTRAEGIEVTGDGRGVRFEGALLRELIYADRDRWFPRILPIVLPGESVDGVPIFLGPRSGSVFTIETLTSAGTQEVRRIITGGSPVNPATPAGPEPAEPPPPARRSAIAELDRLATALAGIRELADEGGRRQAVSWLPPGIREYVDYAPNTRQHLLAIVQGLGRFGESGRTALLELLRFAFPAEDPAVRRAAGLVEQSWLFDEDAGR